MALCGLVAVFLLIVALVSAPLGARAGLVEEEERLVARAPAVPRVTPARPKYDYARGVHLAYLYYWWA